jgi:hypothetical protein
MFTIRDVNNANVDDESHGYSISRDVVEADVGDEGFVYPISPDLDNTDVGDEDSVKLYSETLKTNSDCLKSKRQNQ